LSTSRDHLRALREGGYLNGPDGDGLYHPAPPAGLPESPRENTPSKKGQKTKRANRRLDQWHDFVSMTLAESRPVVSETPFEANPGNYDYVFHLTDLHIGALDHNEHGEITFDTSIAKARTHEIRETGIAHKRVMEGMGFRFDAAHVLLGGDTVDGAGIYENQPWESELTVDDQIFTAVRLLYDFVLAVADEFPAVQVVCQPGNHGEIRANGTSEDLNADALVYGFLDILIGASGLKNVTVVRNESYRFTNFTMRGGRWRAHLRHGDKMLEHVGTSSSKNKWGMWLYKHRFDIAYRGHFHTFKVEDIHGVPVLMSPSIAPVGDFEDMIGVHGRPGAVCHLVSDDSPLEWIQPINFTS
jgi:hypothetical protein